MESSSPRFESVVFTKSLSFESAKANSRCLEASCNSHWHRIFSVYPSGSSTF